jgi:hypothetical protein
MAQTMTEKAVSHNPKLKMIYASSDTPLQHVRDVDLIKGIPQQ